MLKRAAELQGRTMTDFVVSAVQDAAQRAIEQAEVIRLSLADRRVLPIRSERTIRKPKTVALIHAVTKMSYMKSRANMGKNDKRLDKLRQAKATLAWVDVVALLMQLGYTQQEMAGSRVRFTHPTRPMILLHRPHPENHLRGGALKALKALILED